MAASLFSINRSNMDYTALCGGGVISSAVLAFWEAFSRAVPAQIGHAPKKNKGPRALGLIELAPNGKARI